MDRYSTSPIAPTIPATLSPDLFTRSGLRRGWPVYSSFAAPSSNLQPLPPPVVRWDRGRRRVRTDFRIVEMAGLRGIRRGLGQTIDPTKITQTAISTIGTAATPALASTSIGLAMGSAAIPLIGAAVAALTFAVPAIMDMFSGCGQTCIQATSIVNQAEIYLKQNRDAFLGGPKTPESQAVALDTFDKIWAQVLQGCSNPALGEAGQRCISERQRGGSAPWCPTTTGCDWFILYRDPIASYQFPAGTPGTGVISSVLGSGIGQTLEAPLIGGIPTWVFLAGGLALLVVAS